MEELKSGKLYRRARAELLDDSGQPTEDVARSLHRQLSEAIVPWFPPQGSAVEQLHKLLLSHVPFGRLGGHPGICRAAAGGDQAAAPGTTGY